MGLAGFVWWTGKVEDRNDPLQIGRLRVRVDGFYPDDVDAPTDTLPWAMPVQGVVSSAINGVGISPTGIEVGSSVLGFFLDGRDAQLPVILGTWAGATDPDVSKQAQGTDLATKTPVGPEPSSPYATDYPFNKVMTTESGHIIEVDDTAGAERIHVFHKSGSYLEFFPDGRVVNKAINDSFHITVGDSFTNVTKSQTVEILQDRTTTIGGDDLETITGSQTVDVEGNQTFTSVEFTSTSEGPTTLHASVIKLNADTDVKGNETVSGDETIGGKLNVAGKTNLNNSAAVLGSTFTWNGAIVVTDPIQGGGF